MTQTATAEALLLCLSCEDFRRTPDGSWITTRQINFSGPNGEQMLLAEGRQFKAGQMFIFGLDLAAVLERHCAS